MRHKKIGLSFVIVAGLLFTACATVPIIDRQQFILSSAREDARLGQTLFSQLVSQENTRGQILGRNESPEAARLYALVDKVLAKISKTASEYQDLRGLPWSYVILKSNAINAGALPGNRLIFWQGIFKVAPDEPSLAVITGHEVGHVIARHGAERRAQSELLKSAESVLLAAVSKGSPQAVDTTARLYGLTTQVGVALPFSRSHESEADKIGLILMAKAGYDPREAIKVWERMQKEKDRRPSEFLSTHPSPETRINDIEGWLPQALAYYEKADRADAVVVKSGETY
ncbi:MAG: M48 family metallopeptidase [Candidatus Binatia bacterium]